MSFTPKQNLKADYVITGKYQGKLSVEKYDPAIERHRYAFVWPYEQFVNPSDLNKTSFDKIFPGEVQSSCYKIVSGKFAFLVGFDFRKRYSELKEQGWHCSGPSIERLSFDFSMKQKDGQNGAIKVSLNTHGTPYIYVSGGTEKDREEKFQQLINLATMFNG